MTQLHDPLDDLIRNAVHELVAAAPEPKPLVDEPARTGRSTRWLAAAASVLLIGGFLLAALLGGFDDDPGALVSEPEVTTIELSPDFLNGLDTVRASAIGVSPIDQTVEIDRGSLHGIRVGMPVIDASGMVGKVTEVFPETALFSLVSDPAFTVSAKSVSTGARPELIAVGVLSGLGADALPRFETSSGSPVVGDSVLTAGGTTGPAPPDVPIGRVVRVLSDGSAEVELFADLSNLDEVTVLLSVPPIESELPTDVTDVTDVTNSTTEPVVPATPDGDHPLAGSTWTATPLTDTSATPMISTATPDIVVELAGRRLVLGREPSGCCFLSLLAWLDDGDGTWRSIDLGDQFDMADATLSTLGDGPRDVATNGTTAVAVGAIADLGADGDTFSTQPAAWISTDLMSWEQIVIPGSGWLSSVVATDRGWAAVGTIDEGQVVLTSVDGTVWAQSMAAGSDTGFATEPALLRTSDMVVAVFGDGRRAAADGGGFGWSSSPAPTDAVLFDAGDGVIVGFDVDRGRWTRDGRDWNELPRPPASLVTDREFGPSTYPAAIVSADGTDVLLLADENALWVAGPTGWTLLDTSTMLPETPWGPSFVSDLTVFEDGTVTMLGARPVEPGNKPIQELFVWTHRPL